MSELEIANHVITTWFTEGLLDWGHAAHAMYLSEDVAYNNHYGVKL